MTATHRILFVDDEPDVLDALRDALHRKRREWDLTFVSSPLEAVELLAGGEPFDVVLSDMCMPALDGAELLGRAKELQRAAVRVVLSDRAGPEAALRAALVAHLFLAKPCDPDALRTTLERICSVRTVLGDMELRNAAGAFGTLPAAPSICRALVAAVADPDVDTHRIGAIVGEDPALCAKVLQVVNSAFYGLGRRISSVDEAVSYLGLGTIRALGVALAASSALGGDRVQFVEALNRHCALTAHLASEIVGDPGSADDAFLSGMLHDIGKLILHAHDPVFLDEIATEARERAISSVVVERERRDWTHADVGAYLLALWGLPFEVVEAVALHHGPLDLTEPLSVLSAVQIADRLTTETEGGRANVATLDGLDPTRVAAWRRLLDDDGVAA